MSASSLGLCSQLLVLLSSAGEPPLLAHSRHRWPFIQTQTPFLPGEFLNLSASVPIYVMGTVCLLEGLL